MAQYKKNFYGSSYYGETNVFMGWYHTEVINTDEPLKDTVRVELLVRSSRSLYSTLSKEEDLFVYQNGQTTEIDFTSFYYGKDVKILRAGVPTEEVPSGASIRSDIGTTTYTNNLYSPRTRKERLINRTIRTSNTPVELIDSSDGLEESDFYTNKIKITNPRTSNIQINNESTGVNTYVSFSEERKELKDDTFDRMKLIEVDYIDAQYKKMIFELPVPEHHIGVSSFIQLKIEFGTADHERNIEIHEIELSENKSGGRTEDGKWIATLNMQAIAEAQSTDFKEVQSVDWVSVEPEETTLTIRSRSSLDNDKQWDPETVPYTKNRSRAVLMKGHDTGYIDSPLNAPETIQPFLKNLSWERYQDEVYYPRMSVSPKISYDWLNTSKTNERNPYHRVPDAMLELEKNIRNDRLLNHQNHLRITIKRAMGEQTPAVDLVDLFAKMEYLQDVTIKDKEFSAVDNHDDNYAMLQDTSLEEFQNEYQIPAESKDVSYEIIDLTNRPTDIRFYYLSEKEVNDRTGKVRKLDGDKVYVEALPRENGRGLQIHSQYGGGEIRFPHIETFPISPTFTPALNSKLKYAYRLNGGWGIQRLQLNQKTTVFEVASRYGLSEDAFYELNPSLEGISILEANQTVLVETMPENKKVLLKFIRDGGNRTIKSEHNNNVDGKKELVDHVHAEVKDTSVYGWVDWVSEEKVFKGIINTNNIRNDYSRILFSPEEKKRATILYTIEDGMTVEDIAKKFDIRVEDVNLYNKNALFYEGEEIIIPPPISLPEIHPGAVTKENPYTVEIIKRSVVDAHGKRLKEEEIEIYPLEIEYRQVEITRLPMVRGNIENGSDLIMYPRARSIRRVYTDKKIYNEWVDHTQNGDFRVVGNYIEWSGAGGSEPAPEEMYYVDCTVDVPHRARVRMDSDYHKVVGIDKVWRSRDMYEIEGRVTPEKDFIIELPEFKEFEGYTKDVIYPKYTVENDDIWVTTYVREKEDGKHELVGTMGGRDPSINWHPEINPGTYFIGEEEKYLFIEPVQHIPNESHHPKVEEILYLDNGILLSGPDSNRIKDSDLKFTATQAIHVERA